MGTLFLARHATTPHSASGRNLGGHSDVPLSAEGAALSERLAGTLLRELDELPHAELRLVASPALRCRQTLAPFAARLGREGAIETEEGLREIDYGRWDGLTAEECLQRDPELRRAWLDDPYDVACPDGESGRDVAARAFPVLDALTAWAGADRARGVVVVAHNHVNRLFLTRVCGWPLRDYRRRVICDPGGYSMLTFGTDGPIVRRVNAPAAIDQVAAEG